MPEIIPINHSTENAMLIRFGYDIEVELATASAVQTVTDVHPSRLGDIVEVANKTTPPLASRLFTDDFGNVTRVFDAPVGAVHLFCRGVIRDPGTYETFDRGAIAHPVPELPPDVLVFLKASRYCEVDLLGNDAWSRFANIAGGYGKVQAVVDFVHQHLTFDYARARPTRTAKEAFEERVGVCRDFSHLAITLCRCLNIPARYATGYLGDIGVPRDPAPMDFSAWFEAYIGGRWVAFDARHNRPRIGRIVIGYGRDAMDVPMVTTYGTHILRRFEVVTEEIRIAFR